MNIAEMEKSPEVDLIVRGTEGCPAIAGNGSLIAFSNYVEQFPDPSNTAQHTSLFTYNIAQDVTLRLTDYQSHHSRPSVTVDGRFVAYAEYGYLSTWRVMLHDTWTHTNRFMPTPGQMNRDGFDRHPHISNDGRYVTFRSSTTEMLVEDTTNDNDVYVVDVQNSTAALISYSTIGAVRGGFSLISGNGKFIGFEVDVNDLDTGAPSLFDEIMLRPNPLYDESALTVTTHGIYRLAKSTAHVDGELSGSLIEAVLDFGHCWSLNTQPSTSDECTQFGSASTLGTYTSVLTDLLRNQTYYVRAYAETTAGTVYGTEKSFYAGPCNGSPKITDERDDRVYDVGIFGDQCWMLDNLRFEPETTYSWLCYDNLQPNCFESGVLYKYYETDDVCPAGWHGPSDEEWKALEQLFNMPEDVLDATGWRSGPDSSIEPGQNILNGPSNEGMPFYPELAGYYYGQFTQKALGVRYWTSTRTSNSQTWFRELDSQELGFYRGTLSQSLNTYASIRCVRD